MENKELIEFLNDFSTKYKIEEEKLPYHINVLDLIHKNNHIHENAHSSILAKLLQYSIDGKMEILENFIDRLSQNVSSFSDIKINKPSIKTEKPTNDNKRVDILIKEIGHYAIIIENKINDAREQDNQLANYIEDCQREGFDDSQIYILYLTNYGSKPPSPQSWVKNGKSYEELYKKRFINLSFRDDILNWLIEEIKPKYTNNEMLNYALEQYIDHLEGMFNLRKIYKEMNTELQAFIEQKLGLQENPIKNIEDLENFDKILDECKKQINILKEKQKRQCEKNNYWLDWGKKLAENYPEREIIFDKYLDDEEHPKVGVIFEKNNKKFAVLIERTGNDVFVGIGRHDCSLKKYENPLPFVEGYEKDTDDWWYIKKRTEWSENGFKELISLIKSFNNN